MTYKYSSGDDFIIYTQVNLVNRNGNMEYVPYDQFINIEFIAKGGFSKIYKGTWTDSPVDNYSRKYSRVQNKVLKTKHYI
ncbi:uncharacterized protein OCT59_014824 [Rhizophagus irregularis]|uniref:uncharacterized protein n=1 Tax=Rhizophagus irregularis TaxID=588596 RepID=UPI00331F4ED4|nr:hypothetical protein OCT59_014824 [Rhizophagus irregularis]